MGWLKAPRPDVASVVISGGHRYVPNENGYCEFPGDHYDRAKELGWTVPADTDRHEVMSAAAQKAAAAPEADAKPSAKPAK